MSTMMNKVDLLAKTPGVCKMHKATLVACAQSLDAIMRPCQLCPFSMQPNMSIFYASDLV